jgi:peptidoglycan hydrolase-like protein with peptidoglycan-binding domain
MSEMVSRGRDTSRQADTRAAAGAGVTPRPARRRWVLAGGAVLAAAGAGVTVAVTGPFGGAGHAGGGAGNGYRTALSTITRQLLRSQTRVNATLGYAGSYQVTGQGGGTITWLPAAGRVIGQGGVLYRVNNGTPVFLLYGRVPAWRALAEGVRGADVRQLNRALVALGYATSSELDPGSEYFSAETAWALEDLQAHLGLPRTGTLPLGQAVFLPSAIRVTTVTARLGAAAAGPVLAATSARHVVTIALDAAQQSEVKAGDTVGVILPDGRAAPGVVAAVGKVATGGANPTVTVTVRLAHPQVAGTLDQVPVTVSITTATVRNALAVPVTALIARAGGGYAVEEVTAAGRHHLVPVTLGLFDDADGLVQVSGRGLAAGQRIVVPAS